MLERLQKILSVRGVCSRRKAEEYILQGLVRVNGAKAILGQKADPAVDTIEVDGRVIEERKVMLYYVMHKPKGVETTNNEGSRGVRGNRGSRREKGMFSISSSVSSASSLSSVSSVRDLLPPDLRGKIFPVGRLDKDSEGLLLFMNDGVLAYRLTHPSFDHEKEYEVTVSRPIPTGALRKLEDGVKLSGERTKPTDIRRIAPDRFTIILTEGRNRQIRRMCQKVGYPVIRLRRIRITTLKDPSLLSGQIRPLSAAEKDQLLASVGL
ncbi:MAG: pseudouridine synthase [Candidatus Peregrinibacteria bacterium]